MARFTYLDIVKAMQNEDTINLIGEIDFEFLKLKNIESLYYSLPLIERIILEIYKLVPESDIEHYEQGIMKTVISIINCNINILPENTIKLIKEVYDENGIRNKLFHVDDSTKSINVPFENINFLLMQLLSILKEKISINSNFLVQDIDLL